jgi:hypothetical protein
MEVVGTPPRSTYTSRRTGSELPATLAPAANLRRFVPNAPQIAKGLALWMSASPCVAHASNPVGKWPRKLRPFKPVSRMRRALFALSLRVIDHDDDDGQDDLCLIIFSVVASNIHWQWTPNGYLASLLGWLLALLLTVGSLADAFKRSRLSGTGQPPIESTAALSHGAAIATLKGVKGPRNRSRPRPR